MELNMQKVTKVNVIGGGTSGWISAAMLASSFKKTGRDIEVHLIESANIPTIGVGEGTFPTILNTLHEIGISEKDFLAECDGSFKQGALFKNWLHNPTDKEHSYYHPFDPPSMPKGIDLTSYWVRKRQKNQNSTDFCHGVTVQPHLCDNNLGPKLPNNDEYSWMAKYAYHLDAGKLGAMIKKHAIAKLGVKHSFADIIDVQLDDEGYISSVDCDQGNQYHADLFVDCTGMSSFLLGKALKVPFINKSKYLPMDSAVTIQVPYDSADTPIPTHTISTAQEAGWIWDISLQTRRGTGYVYSSKHTTKEEATAVLKKYLGLNNDDVQIRSFNFEVGYREKSWYKNCVAIGFSSGFVEPLEATAIAMVEAGVRSLAARFPDTRAAMKTRQKQYNEIFTARWDNIIDFIKLHYCLTQRDDTQFWREQTLPETIPPSLQEKLDAWAHYGVSEGDFPNKYDIFGIASWQYIIYGLDYIPQHIECGILPQEVSDKALASVSGMAANAKTKLDSNRDLINKYKRS
jgi:tryptophan halogenase